jgi:predicted nucleic acid-binding protein
MKIALDTNVLSYLLFTESSLSRIARLILEETKQEDELIICPAVYAELAAVDDFDTELFGIVLLAARITIDWTLLEPELWLRTGFLYGQYARSPKPKKGSGRRPLADFLILAHFEARADLLLTFDSALVDVANDPRVVYAPDWQR